VEAEVQENNKDEGRGEESKLHETADDKSKPASAGLHWIQLKLSHYIYSEYRQGLNVERIMTERRHIKGKVNQTQGY
jgi:hypothetical protein